MAQHSSAATPDPVAASAAGEQSGGRSALILRVCKLVAASLWAGALITAGALLWPVHPTVSVCAIAAGDCVVMWLIADDLWPNALPGVTTFFKLTGALVFLGELIAAIWLLT